MAQLVLGIAGAAIGSTFGMPQLGFAIGSFVGGALFGPKAPEPQIGDLKTPRASYGSVIPYVEGHPPLPGVVVWNSDKRPIKNEAQGGKGGASGSAGSYYTYRIDIIYKLAENDAGDLRRVWVNGKLVWSLADTATAGTIAASAEAPWDAITLYRGTPGQLPHAAYEAAVGVGNAPAHRGCTTVAIDNLDLGTSGQIPVIKFECGGVGTSTGGGLATRVLYAPFANDSNDTITPLATKNQTLGPEDADLFFDGEWCTFGKTGPTSGGGATPTQSVSFTGAKLGGLDYSTVTKVRISFRNFRVVGSGIGNNVERLFSFAGTSSLFFSTRTTSATTSDLVVSYTNGAGTTTSVIHPEVVFTSGSGGQFNLHIEIPANPANPLAINPTEPTRVYYGSGDPDLPGYTRTLLTEQLGVRNPEGITIGGGNRWNPAYAPALWVQSYFDAKNLVIMRGAGDFSTTLIPLSEPTLQQVVERQCTRAGVSLTYVDATDLASQSVHGFAVTQVTSPRTVIDNLQRAYFFTAVESDKLRFQFLGGATVATLGYDELGAGLDAASPERLPIKVANDQEIPAQVLVKYINNDDDYQDGSEQSDRLTGVGNGVANIELPIVLTPTEAKRVADTTVQVGVVGSGAVGPFSLNRDHAALDPGDTVLVQDRDGNSFRVLLKKKDEADGVLTFEGVLDDATLYSSTALTAGSYTNTALVQAKVDTDLEVLDIPLLRDEDNAVGVYIATQGNDGWPGAAVFKSLDGSAYSRVLDSSRNAIIGVTVGTLGNHPGGNFFDEANVLRVTVQGTGQLASYTRDEVLNLGYGAYLVGSEVIQARNATLVSGSTYDLSGLLRGRRGTEWAMAGHAASERVVALTEATLYRLGLNTSDIGFTRYFNGVTLGRNETTGDHKSLTFAAVSQKPWAVVDVRGERISGDLTLTWKRRTRLSTNLYRHLNPLGETSEAYQVVVYSDNTYTTVKRVISTSSQTATYTAADQTTDFGSPQATVYREVYQLSDTAGRGYPARGTS